VRNHPELTDSQISKLVGTTKQTIHAIRERTHWNMPNIKPVDPVTVGLCSQIELDNAVQKAARRVARAEAKASKKQTGSLKPASETVAPRPEPEPTPEPEPEPEPELDPERVFGPPAHEH
jgi:hypothetical protein